MNFIDSISSVTLGIRFSRSFRIPDISGEIVDKVLSGNKSPFKSGYYISVLEGSGDSGKERILVNKQNEFFKINTDDIILRIKVDNNFHNRYNWLKCQVVPFLENEIFETYKIRNICRAGIVFSHEMSGWKKINEMFSKSLQSRLDEADDISFSFSKRIPIKEALVKKRYNDFRNKIYNFQKSKDVLRLDFDCQHYYDPVVEALGDCKIGLFFDYAEDALKNDFYEWLNEYDKQTNTKSVS